MSIVLQQAGYLVLIHFEIVVEFVAVSWHFTLLEFFGRLALVIEALNSESSLTLGFVLGSTFIFHNRLVKL